MAGMRSNDPIARALGRIPNRLQLAGGWIDQPFVSRLNPEPPGSMVVVQIEPNFRPMDRSGIASGTRVIAMKLWKGRLPDRPPQDLTRELYEAENKGRAEPSGSQDMIGLIYPGVNRLDYDYNVEGGVFPAHIESLNDARVAGWLWKLPSTEEVVMTALAFSTPRIIMQRWRHSMTTPTPSAFTARITSPAISAVSRS